MEKGEIARYEQFLLFPQCFQKACFPGASKGVIVWEWDKGYNVILHYILKTIFIGYQAFQFQPSNRRQDISLIDFHYSTPSNKITMLHILCTRRFFFVLV